MVILNTKNREELREEMVDQAQSGIVLVEREKVTFTSSTNSYRLLGSGETDISIVSIISIEGIRNDGFYVHPTETFQGVDIWASGSDYALSGSVETVAPSYAGTIAGSTLYDYLVWNNNLPKDNTDFLVTYIYFDNHKVSNPNRPTSFADGSLANSFLSAFATIVGNMYNELDNSHKQSYISTATGVDLRLHGEVYGVDAFDASSSSGSVEIINYTNDDFDITGAIRFTTAGVVPVVFKATSFDPIPASGAGGVGVGIIEIESVGVGFSQNVGINNISRMYNDVGLTSLIATTDLTVSNPGVINGSSNLFNQGSNEESDELYKKRLTGTINKRGNATKSAIEGAVNTLPSIATSRVYDWEDKKSIAPKNFQVFVVGSDDKILIDPSLISSVSQEINDVKPVGTRSIIQTPMGVYIDVDAEIFIERRYYADRTNISQLVSNSLTSYINDREVGQDILYSKIIEEAMKVPRVKNFTINSLKASEYAFHVYDKSNTFLVFGSGATDDNPFAQQFTKMARGYRDVFLYSGSAVFNTSGTQISGEITPSVFLAIKDNNDIWSRDPQYAIDWYSSAGTSDVTIDEDAGSGAGVLLTSGSDYLLFDYESYQTHTIDGVRILLSGSVSGSSIPMGVGIYSGASEPTDRLTEGSFNAIDGIKEYEVEFSQITLGSGTNDFWLVVSGTTDPTNDDRVYVLLENAQRIPYGAPSNKYYSGSSWVTAPSSQRYMETVTLNTFITNTDLDITNYSEKSEVAVLNNITTSNNIYIGDEE